MAAIVAVLLVTYIPMGGVAAYLGAAYAWSLLVNHTPVLHRLAGGALLVSVILGNLQILLCLFSLRREHPWFQNPVLKVAAILGQASWGFVGIYFLPWYTWIASSLLLFAFTPHPSLRLLPPAHLPRPGDPDGLLAKLRRLGSSTHSNSDTHSP